VQDSLGGATRSWQTPQCQDSRHATMSPAQANRHSPNLSAEVTCWGTPRANDADKRGAIAGDPRNGVSGQAVNWGTPRVTTNNGIGCPDSTGKGSRPEDQAAEFDR
jgi:hypothetical protein